MAFLTSSRTAFNVHILDTNTSGSNDADITNINNILNQRNLQSYSIILEGENYELSNGSYTPITFSTGMGSIVDASFGVPVSYKRANINNIQFSIVGDIDETFTIYGDDINEGIVIDANSNTISFGDGKKHISYDHTISGVMINSNNSVSRSVYIKTEGKHTSSLVRIRIAINIVNFDTIVDTYNNASGENLQL
jgi:hypothetical protein